METPNNNELLQAKIESAQKAVDQAQVEMEQAQTDQERELWANRLH